MTRGRLLNRKRNAQRSHLACSQAADLTAVDRWAARLPRCASGAPGAEGGYTGPLMPYEGRALPQNSCGINPGDKSRQIEAAGREVRALFDELAAFVGANNAATEKADRDHAKAARRTRRR
jgi:hypothetical protein